MGDHSHAHAPAAGWIVKLALLVTALLVVAEFVTGHLAHSLALSSDAWHNLTDLPTLLLASLAIYFERKPPSAQKTYGYQRAGVLAAFVNALVLAGVAVFILIEGYRRIVHPQPVATGMMFWVGVAALVVNGGVSFGLARGRHDLNVRAVFIHYLGDALSNLGIIGGAWLIRRTGQPILDPVIAFLIAGLILWSAVGVIADSSSILLESLPKGMTLESVATAVLSVPGVTEVHDVHVWSLNAQSHALSCHVHILDMPTSESELIAHRIRELLADHFGITHTTIQFEHTHAPGDFHRYMPEPTHTQKR
jgi:cobalt-zinc-cadmium efflux system protein